MTSKAALCLALLQGKTVSIFNGFKDFGITNVPREIGRAVERLPTKERPDDNGFGVEVSRIEKTGTTRYGQPCRWTQYRLNKTVYNEPGIKLMWDYVNEQRGGKDPEQVAPAAFTQEKLF